MNITQGKIKRAIKLTITGPEGVGKSTLASQCPDPLMIDLESGTDQLDVKRISDVKNYDQFIQTIKEVIAEPSVCKSLVIDTADALERMVAERVCMMNKNCESIENVAYGKGYVQMGEIFADILKGFDKLISLGINVIIIAHSKMRKQELPDQCGAFDRWELKLTRNVAPIVKEWSDTVLFLNYKTTVIETENTKKATGGKRVIYTSHHPTYDAKNRFGFPEEMPLSYDSIKSIFVEPQEKKEPYEGKILVNKNKIQKTVWDSIDGALFAVRSKMKDFEDLEEEDVLRCCSKKYKHNSLEEFTMEELQEVFINMGKIFKWAKEN